MSLGVEDRAGDDERCDERDVGGAVHVEDPLEERSGEPEGDECAEGCGSEPATGHLRIIGNAARLRDRPRSMAA
jgi:hypothetical protein